MSGTDRSNGTDSTTGTDRSNGTDSTTGTGSAIGSDVGSGAPDTPTWFVRVLRKLWVPAGLLVVWALLTRFQLVNTYLIPPPEEVARDAFHLMITGELWIHLAVSLRRVFLGYGITVVAALPLAFLLHRFPRWSQRLELVLAFLRVTPPLALIPILILWLGLGEASKIAVIVLASFFPIFVNAFDGLERVEDRWHELAASLELLPGERVRFVLLPGALPHIVSGLRVGFGYAWRALIGAELFAAASGIGYLIVDSQEMARTDRVMVGILAIGITGLLFDALLAWATNRALPWTHPSREHQEAFS